MHGYRIPILISLPEGEATGIVRTMECGVCVPPENPAAMAAAIERLAGSPVDRQRLAAAARAAAPCIRGMRLRHRCWAYWSHDAEALAESFSRATATLALRNGSYVSHALWHVRKMRATGDEALLRSD